MAENIDLNLASAQHTLDENENPPSRNFNSSVNDSFNLINCEAGKMYLSESQNVSMSGCLPSPQKNALIDSGFHCENLEKAVLPDLVNNSLCESVENEIINGTHEENKATTSSNFLNNDNSLNVSEDSSFNVAANTTTNNIAFLLERLTLNSVSDTSACNDLKNSTFSSALPKETVNDNISFTTSHNPSLEESLDENLHQNVPIDMNITTLVDSSVFSDKNLKQSSVPDIVNEVPFDKTWSGSNSVDMSITNICPETSFDNFKQPLPVNEFNNALDNQKDVFPDISQNSSENLEGEIFQDAAEFFKDPSSFQILEGFNSSNSGTSKMTRDSLYMKFDPLYKMAVQPVPPALVEENESIHEYVGNSETINKHLSSVAAQESLDGNLVSFDSPIKINSVERSEDFSNEDICVENAENNQQFVNKFISNIPDAIADKLVSFDSPVKNESGNSNENNLNNGIEKRDSSVCDLENSHQCENKPVPSVSDGDSSKGKMYFDSLVKSNTAENSEQKIEDFEKKSVEVCSGDDVENNPNFNSPIKNYSEVVVKEEICDEADAENIRQFVENRPSIQGINLLSFDSPMRSISARNSENKIDLSEIEQKLYTEEQFQQALKIYELTMQESYLKKQKEFEEEMFKKQRKLEKDIVEKQNKLEKEELEKKRKLDEEASKEVEEANLTKDVNNKKLNHVIKYCKVLLETVEELASIASEQNTKIGDLSAKIINLEAEKNKLDADLKTSTEDLQSTEHTFSDFHKRYVQCKDMLKTYKENEDALKAQVENLNKTLEEQQQMYEKLQAKMEEVVEKANAEVATAKKGGEAQIAVLKAQLKKSELKVTSLESDLKQVRIENDKLSGICDDLMAKVSEA